MYFLGWNFLSIIVNKTQQSGVRWENQESMCVSYNHTFVFEEKFEGQVANVEGTKGVTLYVLPLPPGEQSIKKLPEPFSIELFLFILWHCFQHGFK